MTEHGLPVQTARPQPSVETALRRFLDLLMQIVDNLDAVLLAVMTVVICWEVFSRFFSKYIPGVNSPWTEEVAMMLMVWFGLTGAAIGIRKAAHIGVEFVVSLFPAKVARYLALLVGLIILVFAVFLLVEGIKFVQAMVGVETTVTKVSRGYFVYLAMPVAAFLMIVYTLETLVKELLNKDGGERSDH